MERREFKGVKYSGELDRKGKPIDMEITLDSDKVHIHSTSWCNIVLNDDDGEEQRIKEMVIWKDKIIFTDNSVLGFTRLDVEFPNPNALEEIFDIMSRLNSPNVRITIEPDMLVFITNKDEISFIEYNHIEYNPDALPYTMFGRGMSVDE